MIIHRFPEDPPPPKPKTLIEKLLSIFKGKK